MIIFYNKKTGEIIGKINGRIHSQKEIDSAMIKPSGVDLKDIGKFIAPFVPIIKIVEEPITEMRITDPKTLKVENVVIGKHKVKKTFGFRSSGKHSKFIDQFEKKSTDVFKYKVKLNKDKTINTFVKITT